MVVMECMEEMEGKVAMKEKVIPMGEMEVLHEHVTRNHQCRFMWQLLDQVRNFLDAASPFGRRA